MHAHKCTTEDAFEKDPQNIKLRESTRYDPKFADIALPYRAQ